LPFGRGKWLGNDWHWLANGLLGNRKVNGITTSSRSVPLTNTNVQNNSNSFSAVQRPNISGDASLPGDRTTDEKLARWFNTGVFAQPAPFTFGNAPRVISNVRLDGIRNIDFSLFKSFPISESQRMELRGEFFNFFNTPQFAGPNQSFGNPNFDVVTAQQNIPRQVQLGLKIYF